MISSGLVWPGVSFTGTGGGAFIGTGTGADLTSTILTTSSLPLLSESRIALEISNPRCFSAFPASLCLFVE